MVYKRALRDSRVLTVHIAFQSLCVYDFQYIGNWRVQKVQKGFKCKNSCSLDAKQT